MMTALVLGVIFSVIDVLILLVVCFGIRCSKISLEEKEYFYSKIFGDGPKYRIKFIAILVIFNLLVEYLIFGMVFYWGPSSWREYELENTKIYYSGEIFEMSQMVTFVFNEDDMSEEEQYIIVEYEENIKATDKAPFSSIFKALQIESKTGRVEYHITSVY